jgi:hypothetical protein
LRELLRYLPAARRRHHHVEQDQIRALPLGEGKRRLSVLRLERLEAFELQVDAADEADCRLVVDDENPPARRRGRRRRTRDSSLGLRFGWAAALTAPVGARASSRRSPTAAPRLLTLQAGRLDGRQPARTNVLRHDAPSAAVWT